MEKKDFTKLTAQQFIRLFQSDEAAAEYDKLGGTVSEDLSALRTKYFSGEAKSDTEIDWAAVKDCLHKYIDRAADPVYANALGEIYGRGICSDGKPDHEKAFYYYMMGAAGGVEESKYKLSDLLIHGNGAAKNKVFSKNVVTQVYESTLDEFLKGDYTGQFAEAAMRMGHNEKYSDDVCFEKNILAYKYYLQARYALACRTAACNYSDETFASRLTNSLNTLATDYPETFGKKTAEYTSLYEILNGSFAENRRLQLKVKTLTDTCFELRFQLLRDGFSGNQKLFITIPETNFCGLKKELKITFTPENKKKSVKEGTYIFNAVDKNTLSFFGKEVLKLDGLFTVKG